MATGTKGPKGHDWRIGFRLNGLLVWRVSVYFLAEAFTMPDYVTAISAASGAFLIWALRISCIRWLRAIVWCVWYLTPRPSHDKSRVAAALIQWARDGS